MIFAYDHTCWEHLDAYFSISAPGLVLMCAENCAFDIISILSGLISVPSIAAQIIAQQFATFVYTIPLGISYAASALAGTYVGEGKIDMARRFTNFILVFGLTLILFVDLLLWLLEDQITNLFTTDPQVVQILKRVMVVFYVYVPLDSLKGIQSGIIKGLGLQKLGSYYAIFVYFIVGLPLACVFVFVVGWGVAEMWVAMGISQLLSGISYYFLINYNDWNLIANRMQRMMKADEYQEEELYRNSVAASGPGKSPERN